MFDRPMRWAQLTLTERDPVDPDYDVAFWLDYFKRTRSDAACLSAGGYVAYYPTEIPLHHRSSWLGDRDPFGELVAGCRELGMVVLARTDPHAVRQDVFDAHPDWIAVDADGEPRRHWANPNVWVTCALGPYNFEYMPQVNAEIVARYSVDGIFSNRWAGSGMCYCEHCRENFRAASGFDLPLTRELDDEAFRAHLGWREDRLLELCHRWDAGIRSVRPEARFVPNSGGGATSDLDMSRLGAFADVLFADRQGRRGVMAPWAIGKVGKEYRAALGTKPVGALFSVGLEEEHRWKDSVQSGAEIRIWVADAIANGVRPWFTKFSGGIRDPRWLDVVEDVYRWHHSVERYLRNESSLARIGLVYSQQTARFYGGERARETVEDHVLGFYHALIEARVPFDMVHDRLLGAADLERFSTLVLPNVAALSDAQCQQLKAFVGRGGSLVATHETSLYDEWGARRDDFGLAELFGVHAAGVVEGPVRNSYLRLDADPAAASGARHALLDGLEGTGRIINGVNRVPVEAFAGDVGIPLSLIERYPDLPMEDVFPRTTGDGPGQAFVRTLAGGGRVVYFPWDVDRIFWEVLAADHGLLLGNAVRWAAGEEAPVVVSGPGVLDVTVWRQRSSMTVHLVNLSNPMMLKGPFRELLPIGPQRVSLRLPAGATVRDVHLLRNGASPEWKVADQRVELVVDSVLDHEVVAVDLEGDDG